MCVKTRQQEMVTGTPIKPWKKIHQMVTPLSSPPSLSYSRDKKAKSICSAWPQQCDGEHARTFIQKKALRFCACDTPTTYTHFFVSTRVDYHLVKKIQHFFLCSRQFLCIVENDICCTVPEKKLHTHHHSYTWSHRDFSIPLKHPLGYRNIE